MSTTTMVCRSVMQQSIKAHHFVGDKLFAYGKGTGANDAVLGFPVQIL